MKSEMMVKRNSRKKGERSNLARQKPQHGSGVAGQTGSTDQELFDRFFAGDDQAFLELFDRHADRIGRYCYRMIGDSARAQDVAQDVWEKFVKLRAKEEMEIRNPLGLLYTMARNLSLNNIRDRRDHISLTTLTDDHHPQAEGRELSKLEEMVIIALEKLPVPQRELLILNSYSDYTFEEIAEIMGESAGTVRTRAWRARQQLKRIIAALIEFEENGTKE